MNRFLLVLMLMIAAAGALAQNAPATTPEPSPAERSIAEAQKIIRENPAQYTGYNLLAGSLVRRARETSDASYYAQAEVAVKTSLQLSPNNFETEKIRVAILLGEYELPAALDAAKELNRNVPDDVMVYGLLTDANAELGNYKDAETAAQWMLDLRPGNLPALLRAAHLRELFGEVEGSYQLLDLAYQSTPPTETEERAWILTQMGDLRLGSGNADAAEKFLRQALTVFPDYPLAVGELATVRVAQKRYQEAVVLFRKRCDSAPRARNLYDLAEALRLAGHEDEARRTFAEFEAKALLESNKKDNSNRELVFYYADRAQQPAKALMVAQQEYSWRHDVYTLDAYAWALHVNGKDQEARKQIETAIEVGIRDAKLFRHAGEIALKSGDPEAAERYLKQSAELNSVDSEQVRKALASLSQAGLK